MRSRYPRRRFLALAGATALAAPPAGSPPLSSLDPARYDRRAAYDIRGCLLGRWKTTVGIQ